MNEFERLIPSHRMRIALVAIGISLIALLMFHAGLAAGSRRAAWGSVRAPWGPVPVPHGFIERGHGIVGTIEAQTSGALSLRTRSGSLEQIRLASTTNLADPRMGSSTLSVGDQVIVLGKPGPDGFHALLIRRLQFQP